MTVIYQSEDTLSVAASTTVKLSAISPNFLRNGSRKIASLQVTALGGSVDVKPLFVISGVERTTHDALTVADTTKLSDIAGADDYELTTSAAGEVFLRLVGYSG